MSIFTSLEGVSYPPDGAGGSSSPRFTNPSASRPDRSAAGGGGGGRTDDISRSRSNCLLMSVVLISIGVMVICGVIVVREYVISLKYSPTLCRVVSISYVTRKLACMHCSTKEKGKAERGAGACSRSHFPCPYVGVTHNMDAISNMNSTNLGQLHTDSLQAKGNFRQCSYAVCLKEAHDNNETVEKYLNKYRKMSSEHRFPCFFDNNDPTVLIEKKYHTKEQVIHSMMWPSIVIFLCALIFVRIELKRRHFNCKNCFGNKKKEEAVKDHSSSTLLKTRTLPRVASAAETPV